MSSGSINRKDFLVLGLSTVTLGSLVEACGDDSAEGGGAAGSSSGGSVGGGTAGAGAGGASTLTGGASSGGNGGVAGSGGVPGTGGSGSGQAGGSGRAGGGRAGGSGQAGGSCEPVGGGEGGVGDGGCVGAGMCGAVTISQPGNPTHTHVSVGPYDLDEAGVLKLTMDLKALINGSTPTTRFTLPASSDGHTHTIKLSAAQVTSLRAGMTVTDVESSKDPSGEGGHTHVYTMGCSV